MRRTIAVVAGMLFLLLGRPASAHRIDEYLQATILSVQTTSVQASMRLIPGVSISPSVIAGIDVNHDGVLSEEEERAYALRVLGDLSITLDGRIVQPNLLAFSFPQPMQMRDGLGEIHIDYAVDVPEGGTSRSLILANHHLSQTSVYLVNAVEPEDRKIEILQQKRNERQTVYELDYKENRTAAAASHEWRPDLWLNGLPFSSLFHLGMRHIAEGTDHLLFLLTLLLPAPLLVAGRRWGRPAGVRLSLSRILGIVTAFTIGHSITLMLAALGLLHVPSRPVEVLIAASIFVSAVHAVRPIVPGKEAVVAGFFGLIHGLAFAATLDRLGLTHWGRFAGVLAFNLGIETMQMVVVAVILPSLMLLSRASAYKFLRVGGAVFAGVASLGWMTERVFRIETPADAIVNALARYAPWSAGVLFLVCVAYRLLGSFRCGVIEEAVLPHTLGW